MKTKTIGALVLSLGLLAGCGSAPVHQAPEKIANPVQAPITKPAQDTVTLKQAAFNQTPLAVQQKLTDGDWYIKAYGDKDPKACLNVQDKPLQEKCIAEAQRK